MVSPIWPHGSFAWSRLSIDAPSTCRKKPFAGDFLAFAVRMSSARWVITARLGSPGVLVIRLVSLQTCGPLAGWAARRPDHSVVMLPGLNGPSARWWVSAETPAGRARWVTYW